MDAAALKKYADKLFDKRSNLLTLWQRLGENFYPERADFTVVRTLGAEFGQDLMTSYPVLARRDLGDSFSALLRQDDWFEMSINREERLDHAGKLWLERATAIQRRAMEDRVARFERATKEGDHDFAAFGQCVLEVRLNRNHDALLYRCWHLRDVAWCENSEGEIDTVVRRWKPFARDLVQMFPKTVSKAVREKATQDPYFEVDCLHVVMASEQYNDAKYAKTKYVSTYLEVKDAGILEQVGIQNRMYVIPRWQTVSGSQYAYSPASIVALADARMIQAMTGVLLEAGEKAVTPPMMAREEAIRSDFGVYAGGITWVDSEYDEKTHGKALELLTNDKSGIPLGLDMQRDVRGMIREAFFLNKLTMPPPGREMTAYEVGQRVSEWVRQSLPLFRPMETEYNGELCEMTFDILFRAGAFGPVSEIPESLSKADVRFKFKTPLRDSKDAKKGAALQQAKLLMAQVADIAPGSTYVLDAEVALRDALDGFVPQKWLRSEDDAKKMADEQKAQVNQQQMLAGLQQGGAAAKDLATANQTLRETGGVQ